MIKNVLFNQCWTGMDYWRSCTLVKYYARHCREASRITLLINTYSNNTETTNIYSTLEHGELLSSLVIPKEKHLGLLNVSEYQIQSANHMKLQIIKGSIFLFTKLNKLLYINEKEFYRQLSAQGSDDIARLVARNQITGKGSWNGQLHEEATIAH